MTLLRRRQGTVNERPYVAAILVATVLSLALPFQASAQLRGEGRAWGTVTDQQGNPIEGAKVVLRNPEGSWKQERTTDADGDWMIYGIRTGSYNLDVTAPGYEPVALRIRVFETKRNQPIEITLKEAVGAGAGLSEEQLAELKGQMQEADAALEAGEYDKALQLYQQAKEEHPEIGDLTFRIGSAYVGKGDYDRAIELYSGYLEENPDDSQALMRLGDAYFWKGESGKAMEILEQVGVAQISTPGLAYNLGEVYFDAGRHAEAAKAYRKAVELDPQFAEAYFKLGLVAVNQGDMELARQQMEKVIELAPDSEDAAIARDLLESLGEGA